MTPERYQQVEKLYHAALALEPEQRPSWLAHACLADAELRAEVESLLAAHEDAGSFIVQPAMQMAAEALAQEQVEANAGRRVGPYQILSLLGAGGMGEVHLAQDSRLQRKVALKLLPAQWANDAERVRRFMKEAKAASALNHPNIITIYEVGQEQNVPYIASEYIDGRTLRQQMAEDALTLDAVLNIALQIAAALTAAHEAGIIHRDIKPENVMVRRDGLVKVLDFGLAKPATPLPALLESKDANSTAPGVILGTLRYMSPEQARGLRVDARTDIFSFGVLLYELLAGRLPFTGRTSSDVLAYLLTAEPSPLPEQVPPELQQLVRQMLGKEPDERYQSAALLLTDLRQLKQSLEHSPEFAEANATNPFLHQLIGKAALPTGPRPTGQTRDQARLSTNSTRDLLVSEIKQHRQGFTVIAVVFLLLLAGGSYGIWRLYKLSRQAISFQEMKLSKLAVNGKLASTENALSPDGKYVAYPLEERNQRSLWVMHLPTGRSVQVCPPSLVGYDYPVFSPDSNYVFYSARDGAKSYTLYRVSVFGGDSLKVFEQVSSRVTFSPDGSQLAYVSQDGLTLHVAKPDGTGNRVLVTNQEDGRWLVPVWSPDGTMIVCGVRPRDMARREYALMQVRVRDGAIQPLGRTRWYSLTGLGWLKDSSELLLTAADQETKRSQLWSLTYPEGEARRVTNDLSGYYGISLTENTQQLLCERLETFSNLWLVPRNQPHQAHQVTFDTGKDGLYGVAWTPNHQLVYTINTVAGGQELWLLNPANGQKKQLTSRGEESRYPTVSPDGRTLVFAASRDGNSALVRMDLESTEQRTLLAVAGQINHPQFTPDGQWIIYRLNQGAQCAVWKVSSQGGEPQAVTDLQASLLAVSPNGQTLAVTYRDTPESLAKLALLPFNGASAPRLLDWPLVSRTQLFRWSLAGTGLTYIDNQGRGDNLVDQPLAGGAGKPLTNFASDYIYFFDWSPDGQWLALARGSQNVELLLITGFNH